MRCLTISLMMTRSNRVTTIKKPNFSSVYTKANEILVSLLLNKELRKLVEKTLSKALSKCGSLIKRKRLIIKEGVSNGKIRLFLRCCYEYR